MSIVVKRSIPGPTAAPVIAPLEEFKPRAAYRSDLLSGIEINQNGRANTNTLPFNWTYQTFPLPQDFKRDTRIPDITGVQLCMKVEDAEAFFANIRFDVRLFGVWTNLAEGSVIEAHAAGDFIWIDAYFNDPIVVLDDWLTEQFRIGVQSHSPIWITSPAAYPNESTILGGTMRFRLLAATADSGEDFLGNKYRSVVARSAVDNFDTQATDRVNAFWLSKPNPSKYAVECLYFDVRGIDDRASVIDRVLVDPITPGMWFHIYHTDEGDPGRTEEEWEDKLWTPVAKSFQADRREEHALPEPVAAKYVCIEFSHLQAQHYSPGTFHQPTRYRKHPKWVADYFLARAGVQNTDDPFVARRVRVTYDALELAYDYYLDDLQSEPVDPTSLLPSPKRNVAPFFSERADLSDQIDASTLERIKISLRPYQEHPARAAKGLEYLLGLYAETQATNNYPVERVTRAVANTSQVSTLDRMSLIVENNYPVMSFYLTSRHKYRIVEASFREDRAYFAGVRELAFTREHYATASDTQLYVETLSDFANLMRNDFVDDGYPPKPLGGSTGALDQSFRATGIPSAGAVPQPLVVQGSAAYGIESQEAFGTPEITTERVAPVTGIASAGTFGTPSFTNAAEVVMGSVISREQFGEPVFDGFRADAIDTGETFGTPTFS